MEQRTDAPPAALHARRNWLTRLCTAAVASGSLALAGTASALEPQAVKVLVINMFGAEATPWIAAIAPNIEIRVPGLSSDYPSVRCNSNAVCQMTTGMGHANAAASTMAVLYSGLFDLRRTYFLIAGIAGIDPSRGTIGSVAWARYAVDVGIAHEIDARELPQGWHDGYFGILTQAPDTLPRLDYRTEVFQLDEALLQRALLLSRRVTLEDRDDVRAYRQHYPMASAAAAPQVIQCDTVSGDTWWTGGHLSEHARNWTRLLTHDSGVYCTTQQEDNATLNALTRGSQSALLDIRRVALLRSGSDFDQPYPHQGTLDGLRTQLALKGAFDLATVNLVLAGKPLVTDIVEHWDRWRDGVPGADTP